MPVARARLDAPILWPALFHHVHPAQQLDAAGHRRHHPRRHLVDVVQQAIDAKAHHPQITPGLQMDVAGPLLERILPQPVHHRDDMLVVGIEMPAVAAQLHQLLEIVLNRCLTVALRTADRPRQIEELRQIALQLQRTGQHRHHPPAQRVRQLCHPFRRQIGLGRGDRHRIRRDLQRQDAIAIGIGLAHHLADAREIHLQRIDAHMPPANLPRQPLTQPVHIQHRMRRLQPLQLALGNHHQRMPVSRRQQGVTRQCLARFLADLALLGQQRQQPVDHQPPAGLTRHQPRARRLRTPLRRPHLHPGLYHAHHPIVSMVPD